MIRDMLEWILHCLKAMPKQSPVSPITYHISRRPKGGTNGDFISRRAGFCNTTKE